jgi:class 3 adenylate cyclase
VFYFDQIGEELYFRAIGPRIELALVLSGVYLIGLKLREGTRVAHGRTVPDDPVAAERQRQRRESDKAAGKAVGKYASHADLVDLLGEDNLAALSHGLPKIDAKVKADYIQRGQASEVAAQKLVVELTKVRERFYPDYDIADFRDGPKEYADEIQACVDRLFPAPSARALSDLVRKARRKLSMLMAGSASRADLQEMVDYVGYFTWFSDRFGFLDAPAPPKGPFFRMQEIKDYFRAFQTYLETIDSRKLSHDTVLSKHFNAMEQSADRQRDFEKFVESARRETNTPDFREWAGGERLTLAIVFTDIVGSTALGEELKDDRMNEVRQAHFAQSRQLIKKCDGREIKTIGDSFMAAFRSVERAVDYAEALQADPGDARVKIRAGIHIGPMNVEENDVFGGAVNFAARVKGAIKGAEIWLSDRAKMDLDSYGAIRHAQIKWERHDGVQMKGFNDVFTLWSISK